MAQSSTNTTAKYHDDDEDYDYLFKIVLIGDCGAGKSNLLLGLHVMSS